MKIKDLLIHETRWFGEGCISWNMLNTAVSLGMPGSQVQVIAMCDGYCVRLTEEQAHSRLCPRTLYFKWNGEVYESSDLPQPPLFRNIKSPTVTGIELASIERYLQHVYD